MDKHLILEKYRNSEEKLLISKLFDKIEMVNKSNKIETTDFLNEHEQNILKNVLNIIKFENYVFSGGIDNSDRKTVVIYPEKMKIIFEQNNFKYDTVFSVFRIKLSKEDIGKFNHSVYLGGLIKLGISRTKIGDIISYDDGADVIVKKELEKFIYTNIKSLNRFCGCDVCLIKLNEIKSVEKKFIDIKIVASSLRLDNIIADLAKTSRSKAIDILEQERVWVNYEVESKATKLIKEKDIITIRGKGKFIVDEIAGSTKKGNYVIWLKSLHERIEGRIEYGSYY